MYNKIDTIIELLDIQEDDGRPLLEKINDVVREYLCATDKNNRLNTRIYQHSLRTMRHAEKLLKKEKADREVVLAALLLHDIGKTITDQRHDIVSYMLSREILTKLGVGEKKKNKILYCVLVHSSKSIECLNLTAEQEVMMDADILDEIGVLTVTKYCAARVSKNMDVKDIIKGLEIKYNEIENESGLLKTKYGKDLYTKKKKNLRATIDSFKLETEMFNI